MSIEIIIACLVNSETLWSRLDIFTELMYFLIDLFNVDVITLRSGRLKQEWEKCNTHE